MEYRTLGKTGIRVSVIAFGAGPVSGWMAELPADEQYAVVRRAIELGVNWFDTAAGYGHGQSERSLGAALTRLGHPPDAQVATKVRFLPEHLDNIRRHARQSFLKSLERLGVGRVALLQLHNTITLRRSDEHTSITPDDILGAGGVLEAFRELQAEGLVERLGLTGIGHPDAMRDVVRSGAFDTMQVPYNLLNPSAGHAMPDTFTEANYGNIIEDCAAQGMGVFAIRVFAGGALAGRPPSAHTRTTPFFPLALYERDQRRTARVAALLGPNRSLKADALGFALANPHISAAIIGFRNPEEIEAAVQCLDSGPLPSELHTSLLRAAEDS